MPKGKEWPYGSLVDKETRRLRWMAPTTLQKGDPNDENGGGCLRRIHYRYVLGLKADEEGAWLGVGIDCHHELDVHLTTGANVLGPMSSAVRPYLPTPDPERVRLLVEHDIGGGDLSRARFGVDVGYPVPFVGYTDVIRANASIWLPSGELWLQSDGQAITENGEGFYNDPPGTTEALDWKFGAAKKGADRDFSKNGPELASDSQMVTQGAWIISKTPTMDAPVRLSHVYTNTKGRAVSSKASTLIPRENLIKRWEYIRGAVRTIADVVRENDPERVPGNKFACESFGGCPYAGKPCKVPQDTGLEMFFGGDEAMAIIDDLNIPGLTPDQPAPVVTAGAGGVAAALGLDIASQLAAFGAPPVPEWKPAQPTKEFVDAIMYIHAKGYGMVPLGGVAAQMFGVLNKHEGITAEYKRPGTGDLMRSVQVDDPARIIAIAKEMAPLPVKPGTQPPVAQTPAPAAAFGITSPETPASNPALAAKPVEGFASPNAITPNVQVPGLMASVPAAQAAQTIANTTPAGAPTNVAATVTDAKPEEPKRRTRGPNKKKPDGSTSTATETSDDARWLFIDCIPNVAYEDCARFVHEWHDGLAKHFKIAAPYNDVRMAGNDHALGYGKGIAALESVAKNAAKHLPPGAYYINTEGELARAVALGLTMARFQNPDGTDGDPVFELISRGGFRR